MSTEFVDALIPKMSDAEVACYVKHLSGADAVLEYGVGGSTILAASNGVKSLYSIDTDAVWLAKVAKQETLSSMLANGAAHLVHVDLGRVKKWGKPINYALFYRWPSYAKRPWQDGYKPDLALVDGRFRVSCIMQCIVNGGKDLKIAVHDFWKRPFYHGVLEFASVVDTVDTLVVLKGNSGNGLRQKLIQFYHKFDRR